eukprot:11219763-Lingulodinium_polyedra.AAC.1
MLTRPAQGPTPTASGARGSPGAYRRPNGHRADSDCAGSPRSRSSGRRRSQGGCPPGSLPGSAQCRRGCASPTRRT